MGVCVGNGRLGALAQGGWLGLGRGLGLGVQTGERQSHPRRGCELEGNGGALGACGGPGRW